MLVANGGPAADPAGALPIRHAGGRLKKRHRFARTVARGGDRKGVQMAGVDRLLNLLARQIAPQQRGQRPAVEQRRGVAPLLLLDDVLSELDASRRHALADRIARTGQTVVTATGADALPLEPAQLLRVTPGEVRAA